MYDKYDNEFKYFTTYSPDENSMFSTGNVAIEEAHFFESPEDAFYCLRKKLFPEERTKYKCIKVKLSNKYEF